MRFLADENVETEVVEALRAVGHDVAWIIEGQRRASDTVVLALARREGRVVITNDKDFGEIAFRLHARLSGIVLFRYPDELLDRKVADLLAFLRQMPDIARRFTVISPGRVRSRPVP